MAKRDIITIPDAKLRELSQPVGQITPELLALLDDMAETMYAAPGIGLAAIQIAEPVRALVVDCNYRSKKEAEDGEVTRDAEPDEETKNPIFMINPEIVSFSEAPSTYEEGCLSIPDYYAEVERPASCVVKYLDREGAEQVLEADGLLSTCVQHEMDHLDGKLFIDLLSKLKRDRVIKKFTKIAKQSGTLPDKRMIG
ncbi:MAG: peptide deformylase [Rhizobiaceae bacterium]|nr:peptide deformylase [Rhizobiaceae bacterium]